MIVPRDTCEDWIRQAVETIPVHIRRRIENVAFILEDRPRPLRPGETPYHGHGLLLGLYQGVPLPSRGGNYTFVTPDRITIFQDAIEQVSGPDPEQIQRQIQDTVWHEVAHYLGMNEAEVRSWEKKRRNRGAQS